MKYTPTLWILFVVAAAVFITCSSPSNPYTDPNSAKVTKVRIAGGGELDAHQAYACSLDVFQPKYVDTVFVIERHGRTDTIFVRDSLSEQQTLVTFSITPTTAGACTLSAIVLRRNSTADTTSIVVTVRDFSPVAVPESTVYHAFLGQSVKVRFFISDPDSNLLQVFAGVDSTDSRIHDTTFSYFSNVKTDTMVRVFGGDTLLAGLTGKLLCYCLALDRDSLTSATVACTISVRDTTHPVVVLLSDTADTIKVLPCTLSARVSDNWRIDSVHFNGLDMIFSGSDTASVTISSLDSGKSRDSITAYDGAGNKTIVRFPLNYAGHKTYPPKIKPLDAATTEGVPFPAIQLDSSVIVSDPADTGAATKPPYLKRLTWVIQDSAGNSLPIPASHLFAIPVPLDTTIPDDSLWTGSFKLSFQVIDPVTGLSDAQLASFFVTAVDRPPTVILQSQFSLVADTFKTIALNQCGYDPDNAATTLSWTFKNGKYLKVDSLYTSLLLKPAFTIPPIRPILFFARKIDVVPDTTKLQPVGAFSDTIVFTVTDPAGLSATKKIGFTKH